MSVYLESNVMLGVLHTFFFSHLSRFTEKVLLSIFKIQTLRLRKSSLTWRFPFLPLCQDLDSLSLWTCIERPREARVPGWVSCDHQERPFNSFQCALQMWSFSMNVINGKFGSFKTHRSCGTGISASA